MRSDWWRPLCLLLLGRAGSLAAYGNRIWSSTVKIGPVQAERLIEDHEARQAVVCERDTIAGFLVP